MARIPDAELARLKAEVSVQRLVEGCGVVLREQGKDLVGLVPVPRRRLPVAGGHARARTCGTAWGPAVGVVGRSTG